MQYFKSFRGVRPLDPHQGSALDPLGVSQRPQTPSWHRQCSAVIAYRAFGTIPYPKTYHACIEIRPQFFKLSPCHFSNALENFYPCPGENMTQGASARGMYFSPGLYGTLSDPRTLSDPGLLSDPETLQSCSLSDTGNNMANFY